MPSLEHDGVVELFRDNPRLAARLLEQLFHIEVPPYASARVANASLDQLVPVEFRADLVLELLDAEGKFVLAIVLEAQRDIDRRKEHTWVVYVAVSRAERECPAIVMVVAVDAEVAAWASQPIDIGLGLGTIQPVVLGPRTLPPITDERMACEDVELSVLSAMAHGNGTNGLQVLGAALEGLMLLGTLDGEHAAVYFQIIWKVLREPMQRAFRRLVMDKQQTAGKRRTPDFILEMFDAELREGRLEAERDAAVRAQREHIVRLVSRRGLALTEEQRARIQACTDEETLERWFDNSIDAQTADEVFR